MKAALLLIDLQEDFLNRPGLVPEKSNLVERCGVLLDGWRRAGLSVLHAYTIVSPDGADRMPHWKKKDYWACVEGTPGSRPPPILAPRLDEAVFRKTMFSAFGNSGLDEALRALGVDTLVLGGVYLHSCVRATALDAYARGFEVWIAADAVGSTEPGHALMSRRYLDARAASFESSRAILARVGGERPRKIDGEILPVANVAGRWLAASDHELIEKRNPSAWDDVPVHVPAAKPGDISEAGRSAAAAQIEWQRKPAPERASVLRLWASRLRARQDRLAQLMAHEIGKPVADAVRELIRASDLVELAADLAEREPDAFAVGRSGAMARRRPLGVVGLITPWNNPIGIPVGKIAPALAFGNAALWKPAWQAPRSAMAVIDSLEEAGLRNGLVNLVMGGAEAAEHVILDPNVAAVSLTGSFATGRLAQALCAEAGKPLQAELGGNNGAIVMPDCDVARFAPALARGAFAFSGQRCTATRRFIVHESLRPRFDQALIAAAKMLRIGLPAAPETALGPLSSRVAQMRVQTAIADAVAAGARLLGGGGVPDGYSQGCWLEPAILACDDHDAAIVQEETFGPVAVIETARNFEDALEKLNGVPQGLVASLYSDDRALRRRFAEEAAAGMLRFNETGFDIDPGAPFLGWKTSGLGPPEHGVWDRDFYTRPQAVYGFGP